MSAEQIDQPEIESLLSSCQLEGGGSADQIMFAAGLAAGRAERSVATPVGWKAATAVLAASLLISLGWNVRQLSPGPDVNAQPAMVRQAVNDNSADRLAARESAATPVEPPGVNSPQEPPTSMELNTDPLVVGFVATASGRRQRVELGSSFYSTTEVTDPTFNTGLGRRIPTLGSF